MNYLAHLHLSGDDEDILTGNFIGDSMKGLNLEQFPPRVRIGIRLHRHIDVYTDTHPVVSESKRRLRPHFRKFSPVVSDIYFDHLLAVNWTDYHSESLADFADRTYQRLQAREPSFPPKAKRFFHNMVQNNLLCRYADVGAVDHVLAAISKRSRFPSNMENAGAELKANYSLYEREFRQFFPDLQASTEQFLATP